MAENVDDDGFCDDVDEGIVNIYEKKQVANQKITMNQSTAVSRLDQRKGSTQMAIPSRLGSSPSSQLSIANDHSRLGSHQNLPTNNKSHNVARSPQQWALNHNQSQRGSPTGNMNMSTTNIAHNRKTFDKKKFSSPLPCSPSNMNHNNNANFFQFGPLQTSTKLQGNKMSPPPSKLSQPSSLFQYPQKQGNESASTNYYNQRSMIDDINFKSNQIKDFQKAYTILASKLIQNNNASSNNSNILLTKKSVEDYVKQKQRVEERKQEGIDIHSKLYKEKERYFEKKNFVNNEREEEEFKKCTFQPNSGRQYVSQGNRELSPTEKSFTQMRSFDQFYKDQLDFAQKEQQRKKKIVDQDEKKIKQYFKPNIYSKSNRSVDCQESPSRALSPLEKSEILYKAGKDKLLKLNDKSYISDYYKDMTHRPTINENSEKIMQNKSESRIKVNELYKDVYQKKVQKEKEFEQKENIKQQLNLIGQKNSLRLIVEKIDKEMEMGFIELDIAEEQGLSFEQLFQFLDTLDYLNKNSKNKDIENQQIVQNIWTFCKGNINNKISKRGLKLILCGVYNIWQPKWMMAQSADLVDEKQVLSNQQSKRQLDSRQTHQSEQTDCTPMRQKGAAAQDQTPDKMKAEDSEVYFQSEEEFSKFHQQFNILQINKSQNTYHSQKLNHKKQQCRQMSNSVERKMKISTSDFNSSQIGNQRSPNGLQKITSLVDPLHKWFKPQICKKSESIDRKMKEKKFGEINSTFSDHDASIERPLMMIQKGQLYKENIQKKREEKENQETEGCSFKPVINSKFNNKHLNETDDAIASNSSRNLRHFHKMYEQRKIKSPRKDKSPLDIEFEKSKPQCTFKPEFSTQNYTKKNQISPRYHQQKKEIPKANAPGPHKTKMNSNYTTSKQKRPTESSKPQQKGYSKVVDLQSTSKLEQQAQHESEQTIPINGKEMFINILEEDRTPLLYLEVNLGKNQLQRLVVFEGDDPMSVVNQFSKFYNLNDEKKVKLARVVQEQLSAILPRIEESDEDEPENHHSQKEKQKAQQSINKDTMPEI